MTIRYKTVLERFTRGGDTFRQKLAMLMQNAAWIISLSILAAILFGFLTAYLFLNADEWTVWWQFQIARVETFVGLGSLKLLSIDGKRPFEIVQVAGPFFHSHFGPTNFVATMAALGAFVVCAVSITKFYFKYGTEQGKEEFLRGIRLIEKDELIEQVNRSPGGAGDYKFAGVPLPKGKEMRNVFATGAMGSGKSQTILDLAQQVAARGRKMIIYDKAGEFTEAFFRPEKDFVLNPFDARYPGWNIFKEIEYVYEFEQIAHSLIPDPPGGDATALYFAGGARTVLASVLEKLWREDRRTIEDLAEVILTYSNSEIAEYLAGTPATPYISTGAGEQSAGVLSTVVGAMQVIKYVSDGAFSIKEWVKRDDDSRLFLNSHETIHEIVKPLFAMYLDVALRTLMSGDRVLEDRIWIFADEFASLGPMRIFKSSLTEARKYGGVHVLGAQNVSQMRSAFGKDDTQTLRSNLQNSLILRVADEETQEAYSKLLGSMESDEQSEGVSFGSEPGRDGASVNTGRKEKRIVMPSEIKMLNDCEGYLQVAGAFDVAKVAFTPRTFEQIAQGYMLRPELRLDAAPLMPMRAAVADTGLL